VTGIGHWLYHWAWQDFYVPVWPNIAASAVLGPLIWLKLRAIQKLHKEHFEWHKNNSAEGDQ